MGTVKSTKQSIEKEDILDDIKDESVKTEEELDDERLEALKARMAKKQKSEEDMPPKIVTKKTRSIKIGVVGSGQAGSRLAQEWHKLGYEAIAINTAEQDLKFIEIPEANKLLLDYGLGGAAKDLEIGQAAAEAHREAINELVNKKLGDCQLLLFCTSLGGGSGAGSAETIVDILGQLERPVAVITVLPQSSDDAQTKQNALVTLSKFAKMAQSRLIDNLIVVDNAKIESIYSNVSQLNFFGISNSAIVEPIDAFNTLSSQPSQVKGLDPTEFGRLFTDGQGLTTYGQMEVSNYEDVDSLADAIIDNLNGTLLASGFNLKESRYVGVIFAAPQKVWDKIPQAATTYAMAMVNEACGTPLGVFKGIYTVDSDDDFVKVYSMFSGLGLPQDRVEQLKSETKSLMAKSSEKDNQRNLNLKVDVGESSVSEAERIRNRIKAKKSSFGKLHHNAVVDKRK